MLNLFNTQKNTNKENASKNIFNLSSSEEKKMWKQVLHEASQDQMKVFQEAKKLDADNK